MSRPRSLLASMGVALLLASIATPSPAATPNVLTVGGPATNRAIPAGFLGLSLEYFAIPAYAGTNPSAINPVFVQLVRNLAGGESAGAPDRRRHDRPDLVAGSRDADPGRREQRADPGLARDHESPRRGDGGAAHARDQPRGRQRHRGRHRGERARRRDRRRQHRGARARQRTRAVRDVQLGPLGQARTPARLRFRRVQPGLHPDRRGAPERPARRACRRGRPSGSRTWGVSSPTTGR